MNYKDQKMSNMEKGLINENENDDNRNEKYDMLIKSLISNEFYSTYSYLIGIMYISFYICFIITYAIYKPELLKMSFEWKVYGPIVYLAFILGLLSIECTSNTPKKLLFLKSISNFFFVGTYHQMLYIYDNILNFTVLFTEIIDWINFISDYFDKDKFWVVMGIIIAVVSIMIILIAGPVGTLGGIIVIQLVFLMFGLIFFLMLLFPISFYFYQILIWPTYISMLLYEFYDNIKKIREYNKMTK
jgi:hypothetical protein